MPLMIDTNIAIHARDGDESVLEQLEKQTDHVLVSALTIAELERGIATETNTPRVRRVRLDKILEGLIVEPFDRLAARRYGELIASLGWVRARDFDRMIAAHALTLNASLVTRNRKDFADIPELELIAW